MANLAGLHDIEATAIAAPDTWILDTIAISENPAPKHYPVNLNVIVRVNWGYGSAGTLPLPSVYEAFAQRVAAYVNGCRNCRRWIIGNEPNLSREWPDHQPIYPWHYGACYKLCHEAIHALPGHAQDEVLIAASGPWNDELKYTGNAGGDWITYFEDTIRLCDDVCDGFAIHAYTHAYDPALVTSTARMDAPFQNRYYEFRTYQDYMRAIPEQLRHKPTYLTEAEGNGPWQAVGLMPEMLAEVDGWNQAGGQPIHCVIFYRYPRYDSFFIEGRQDVIAEYRGAVARGYESPGQGILPVPPLPNPEPPEPTPTPPDPDDDLVWDKRLTVRGCSLQPALMPTEILPRVKIGRWFDREQAQGRVNIYVRLLDERGELATGIPMTFFWADGSETKPTERKSDPWLAAQGLGAEYSLDFAMYNLAPSYGVRVTGGYQGDIIDGCGLGSIEQPDYKIHTAYFFEWQLSSEAPDRPPLPPLTPVTGRLLWPVTGPVTQWFGEGDPAWGQKAHNGIDIAVAEGTPVAAIADGVVMFTGLDDAYGYYCRIFHPTLHSHSFYAHLSSIDCAVGEPVSQGAWIAHSGNTGNSTGPHLHFELRAGNKDGYYHGVTQGYTQGRYNPVDAYVVTGSALMP